MKQSGHGHSPPARAASCGQIRCAWPADGRDGIEQRCAKAARSGYAAATPIPARDSAGSSWERRAAADDAGSRRAAGIWPPRAYPCTFCRREFRSAQALGGHMNVHRRDRARLRHSSPPQPSPDFSQALAARPLLQFHDKYSANLSNNEPAMALTVPAIHISKSISLPAAPYSSLTSDNAKSLPLRLQQLASEAAASLLQQQERSKSSDLLSFLPPSIPNQKSSACHFRKETGVIKEKSIEFVSMQSPLASLPSSHGSSGAPLIDAATGRRDIPLMEPNELEDNTCADNDQNHPLIGIIKDANTCNDVLPALGINKTRPNAGCDSPCMLWRRGAFGEHSGSDLDLELRLGRKPS